ncbi:MAG TPA: ABC-2 family transporter protein [Chloroflexota bacterium]|jgi:ABC-2 type transport system permease protein|nr:ABC-2 family transporter protein [Chloroflexota bacterium]
MRVYYEVARRAFQRELVYRTRNLAGLFTNACFGYLRAVPLLAAFQGRPEIAGYDLDEALTWNWVVQALIMVIALWGWWDVEATVRSGDVVSDLARPISFLGYWLARDYGRALYYILFRCLPILLVGQLLFGLRWPQRAETWLLLALSLILAVAISFAFRFMLNLSAFWTTDARGLGSLALIACTFFSGFLIPISFFPSGLRAVTALLPFAGMIQTPADVFLERLNGAALAGALLLQAFWALALLGAAQGLIALATRRVVVQGG